MLDKTLRLADPMHTQVNKDPIDMNQIHQNPTLSHIAEFRMDLSISVCLTINARGASHLFACVMVGFTGSFPRLPGNNKNTS